MILRPGAQAAIEARLHAVWELEELDPTWTAAPVALGRLDVLLPVGDGWLRLGIGGGWSFADRWPIVEVGLGFGVTLAAPPPPGG